MQSCTPAVSLGSLSKWQTEHSVQTGLIDDLALNAMMIGMRARNSLQDEIREKKDLLVILQSTHFVRTHIVDLVSNMAQVLARPRGKQIHQLNVWERMPSFIKRKYQYTSKCALL
jgi:hypothetical protein